MKKKLALKLNIILLKHFFYFIKWFDSLHCWGLDRFSHILGKCSTTEIDKCTRVLIVMKIPALVRS